MDAHYFVYRVHAWASAATERARALCTHFPDAGDEGGRLLMRFSPPTPFFCFFPCPHEPQVGKEMCCFGLICLLSFRYHRRLRNHTCKNASSSVCCQLKWQWKKNDKMVSHKLIVKIFGERLKGFLIFLWCQSSRQKELGYTVYHKKNAIHFPALATRKKRDFWALGPRGRKGRENWNNFPFSKWGDGGGAVARSRLFQTLLFFVDKSQTFGSGNQHAHIRLLSRSDKPSKTRFSEAPKHDFLKLKG